MRHIVLAVVIAIATAIAVASALQPPSLPAIVGLHGYSGDVQVKVLTPADVIVKVIRVSDDWVVVQIEGIPKSGVAVEIYAAGDLVFRGVLFPGSLIDVYDQPERCDIMLPPSPPIPRWG